jgi:peptidoglycan hydrolase-like protein with peptidoglycan-binding domain
MSTTTLIVAGAMLAGSAFAQTTTPSGDQKAREGMKSDSGMKPESGMKSESRSRTGGMAAGGEHVKAVQQALKDKGHDPGEVDGKMGPKTQAAVRDFQSKEGLTASGRLDAETMSKLGVEAKAGAAATGRGTAPSASPSGAGATTPGSATGSSSAAGSGGASSSGGATGSDASAGTKK